MREPAQEMMAGAPPCHKGFGKHSGRTFDCAVLWSPRGTSRWWSLQAAEALHWRNA
jgi:hypothetical protein